MSDKPAHRKVTALIASSAATYGALAWLSSIAVVVEVKYRMFGDQIVITAAALLIVGLPAILFLDAVWAGVGWAWRTFNRR